MQECIRGGKKDFSVELDAGLFYLYGVIYLFRGHLL